jgi:hypothetical protein
MTPHTTRNGDGLDRAIDRVAAQLTHVDDDPGLASRIADSLPERQTWQGWLSHSWVPRLAALAVIVTASVLWSEREPDPARSIAPPIASVERVGTHAGVMFAATIEPLGTQPLEPVGTQRLEPVEPLEPVDPSDLRRAADFDRSLPPIEAVAALELDSLMPAGLPEDAPLTVEPLATVDLPLSAEFIPPR